VTDILAAFPLWRSFVSRITDYFSEIQRENYKNPKPVYLTCDLISDKGRAFGTSEIVLNERDRTVTYESYGKPFTQSASFGAEMVSWIKTGQLGSVKQTINRITLTYTVRILSGAESTMTGKCRLIDISKRKF
jgi:hypothetical protein